MLQRICRQAERSGAAAQQFLLLDAGDSQAAGFARPPQCVAKKLAFGRVDGRMRRERRR